MQLLREGRLVSCEPNHRDGHPNAPQPGPALECTGSHIPGFLEPPAPPREAPPTKAAQEGPPEEQQQQEGRLGAQQGVSISNLLWQLQGDSRRQL